MGVGPVMVAAPAGSPSRDPEPATGAAGLRRLLWGRGVSALGDGLWFTIWALYFTRIVDLPLRTVGAGMALAAAVGLAAAVPLGALADRRSPRVVLVAVITVRAAAMAGFLLVGQVWSFLAVTVAYAALANGGNAVRTALVAALVRDNTARVAALARQRVAQHIGYAAGAGLGAVVLAVDNRTGYVAAIAVNAVSYLVLAVAVATIAEPAPGTGTDSDTSRRSARIALRDRPYLVVTGTVAVLSLCWAMLSTGLPLWISEGTRLPLALSGVVVVISSVGIAALQIPATRLARTPRHAARTVVAAGITLAASCLLLAGTAGRAGVVAVAVVVLAALLHLAGELGYVAAAWTLSMSLMREEAKGAYQGLSEAATATVQIFGPAVFTLAVGAYGATGWLLVAGVFLLAALPVPALVRWALRSSAPLG